MKYLHTLIFTLLLLSITKTQIVQAQSQTQAQTNQLQTDLADVSEEKEIENKMSQSTVSATTDKNKELLKQSLIDNIKKENINMTEEEVNSKVDLYLKDHGDELLKKIQDNSKSNNSQTLSDQEKDKILKSTIAGVAAAATPILINAISASVISAVGFTAGGVAAGSIAAGVQAGLGGIIVQGGTFALLQSAGATGAGIFGATLGLPLVIAGLAIGAGVGAYFYFS